MSARLLVCVCVLLQARARVSRGEGASVDPAAPASSAQDTVRDDSGGVHGGVRSGGGSDGVDSGGGGGDGVDSGGSSGDVGAGGDGAADAVDAEPAPQREL